MRKKIVIIDYLNHVNDRKESIGHGKKVLNEAIKLLKNDFDISIFASKYYICDVYKDIKIKYLFSISYESFSKRFKKILNILKVVLMCRKDIIWFTNVEWDLLLCLPLMSKKVKIIITCYGDIEEKFKNNKIKLFFIKKGIKRANLVITTNPNLSVSKKQICIPDFIYFDWYDKYRLVNKIERIVCVGAMRQSKDINGIIEKFKNTDIEVLIVGNFPNKKEFDLFVKSSTENIKLKNLVLNDEEYYSLIASSKYVILPYKMECYKYKTSGILQECMFLDTIPIAPRELLEFNNVNGIGYDNLSDLPTTFGELSKIVVGKNDLEIYKEENVRIKIVDAINNL